MTAQQPLKASRRYDSSRRQAQARLIREAILDSAQRQFLGTGFAATTVASIASRGRRLQRHDLQVLRRQVRPGPGDLPARPRGRRAGAGRAALRRIEVQRRPPAADHPRVGCPDCRGRPPRRPTPAPAGRRSPGRSRDRGVTRRAHDADRLRRMTQQRRALHDRGFLRDDLTVEMAGQICWTYSSPELYRLLVLEQHWPVEDYGRFVADALTAALLPRPMR